MSKIYHLLLTLTIMVTACISFSSCKDDDEGPFTVSFPSSTIAAKEGENLEIKVTLSRPAPEDVTVSYQVSGTANDPIDYEISPDEDLVIEQGKSEGIININVKQDGNAEPEESIELTILDISNTTIQIGNTKELTITIGNDDQEVKATFLTSNASVSEDQGLAGNIEIPIQLDKAATGDVRIEYELAGTALDSITGFNEEIPNSFWDYYVDGVAGEAIVPAGQTEGSINLRVLTDFQWEGTETIELTIRAVNGVTLGAKSKMTINLLQQDGKVIELSWDDPANTDVDMDMFLWIQDGNEFAYLESSANASTSEKFELLVVPYVFENATFGLSHNYYEGTKDPLNFKVTFADFINGELEPEANFIVKQAQYGLVNINPWATSGQIPVVVQTFQIINGEFANLSEIEVPAEGSRIKNSRLTSDVRRYNSPYRIPLL